MLSEEYRLIFMTGKRDNPLRKCNRDPFIRIGFWRYFGYFSMSNSFFIVKNIVLTTRMWVFKKHSLSKVTFGPQKAFLLSSYHIQWVKRLKPETISPKVWTNPRKQKFQTSTWLILLYYSGGRRRILFYHPGRIPMCLTNHHGMEDFSIWKNVRIYGMTL